MKTIKSEYVVMVDVDDTLVMHCIDDSMPSIQVYDTVEDKFMTMHVNMPMVRLMKEEKSRGAYIIVWSAGGYEYASNVIRALHLEKFVDEVMSKPKVYLDDKPVEEWLKYRVWIDPKTVYKNVNKTKETEWVFKKLQPSTQR